MLSFKRERPPVTASYANKNNFHADCSMSRYRHLEAAALSYSQIFKLKQLKLQPKLSRHALTSETHTGSPEETGGAKRGPPYTPVP